MNMFDLFSQAQPINGWNREAGTPGLWGVIALTALIGFAILFGLLRMPPQGRRWVIWTFTFVSGLFYVLLWLWPKAQGREAGDIPNNFTESVAFYLTDATSIFGNLSSILTAMLLLLGVFSLIRIHVIRIAKMQKDWFFSIVMLVSLFGIASIGYWNWLQELWYLKSEDLDRLNAVAPNMRFQEWPINRILLDLTFEGMLQAMDAAMFSIIAFYILSAAYRAFRIRSVEATILLASALLVMLSLLGAVEATWNGGIKMVTGGDSGHFANNFRLSEIALFIRQSFQSPGLRAIDFGIGVGALAMALRLWLGLERGGGTSN